MTGGDEELHVGGHVEGEGEEGNDDQVNQADSDGRKGDWGVERAEVEFCEADCWRQGLRREFQMSAGDAAVCKYLLGPLGAKLGGDVGSYLLELWDHVRVDGILVACFDVEELE